MQDLLQKDKLNSIRDGVLAAIESLCLCILPVNTIDNAVFSCRDSNTAVVYKAHISITNNLMSSNQMLHLISKWVKTSPSVIVLRTLLQLDPSCPTELETLLSDDCQSPLNHSKILLYSTAAPSHTDTDKLGNVLVGIIGATVGVLVAMTIMVIIIIGCILVFYKSKQTGIILDNW